LGDTIDEDNLFGVDLHINLKVKRYDRQCNCDEILRLNIISLQLFRHRKIIAVFSRKGAASALQKRYVNTWTANKNYTIFNGNVYIFIITV